MAKLRARVSLSALVAASVLAACSLTTDLSGLVGGADPTAVEAGTDARESDGAIAMDAHAPRDALPAPDGPLPDGAPPCVEKTSGPKLGGMAQSLGSGSNWMTPSAALVANGAGSSVVLTALSQDSATLTISAYGFGIPAAAVIKGVTVVILRKSGSLKIRDNELRLIAPGAAALGEDKKAPSDTWSVNFVPKSYGGASDLWGFALTPAHVNNTAFGVAFKIKYEDTAGNSSGDVDEISITVAYCE